MPSNAASIIDTECSPNTKFAWSKSSLSEFREKDRVKLFKSSLGIFPDNTRFGKEGIISTSNSKIPVYVIGTNEELMMARDALDLIK